MSTLEELQARRKVAEGDLVRLKAEAIRLIKAQMADLGITVEDLGGVVTKSPVRFRDKQGNTWTGVGKRPQWVRDALLAGRTLDEFAVKRK